MEFEQTHSMDIINNRGRRFTVVFAPSGYRYQTKVMESGPLVEFYDSTHRDNGDRCHLPGNRRLDWSMFGQFVSGYDLGTMLTRDRSFGLNLYGGEEAWSLDAHTMLTVHMWLEQIAARVLGGDRVAELAAV